MRAIGSGTVWAGAVDRTILKDNQDQKPIKSTSLICVHPLVYERALFRGKPVEVEKYIGVNNIETKRYLPPSIRRKQRKEVLKVSNVFKS